MAPGDVNAPQDLSEVTPPSAHLMEHLWEKFGERPLSPLHASLNEVAAENHAQVGREQVLNYLDEMLNKGAPQK